VAYDRVNTVMCVFLISPEDAATKAMLTLAAAENGESKEAVYLRRFGAAMLKYLESRQPALIESYGIRPSELEKKGR